VNGPGPLGGEIRRELQRLGPGGALGDVVAAWARAVGPAIAANAWPARIARDGTLHVATTSSAWAFELTQLAETVGKRLAEQLGEVSPPTLRFAPGPVPEAGAESVEEDTRTVPESSLEVRRAGEQLAAKIANSALREAVARAATASLAAAEREPSNRPVW
jgi:hypothetical protein